jgi:phospholipid/cholesterol/gamma-HCH transport system substrate-binding protein
VIASPSTTLQALDARRGDLDGAVDNFAAVLETIASRRAALADILGRTTTVLDQLKVTFGGLRRTLPTVAAAFKTALPDAKPLVGLLRRVTPATNDLLPTLADLRAQLPDLRTTLAGLPQVAAFGVPALQSATTAIRGLTPIFTGLRPYTLDWMAGAVTLIGSVQYAYYDALGHYARETILGGQESLTGLASLIPQIHVPSPTAPVYRTGLLARCPGSAAAPAPDHSSPWIPDPKICSPQDNGQ